MKTPRHIMVCISGFSGTGKDEAARVLVEKHGAVQTGLADPAKRHMADVYGFTEHQLFGPSSARNSGDMRYPKAEACGGGLVQLDEKSVGTYSRNVKLVGSLDPRGKYWVLYSKKGVMHGPDGPVRPYIPVPGDGLMKVFVREGDPEFWLSPREALQKYCETMNNAYLFTWVDKGLSDHLRLAEVEDWSEGSSRHLMRYGYSRMAGVVPSASRWVKDGDPVITCFADFRHRHELSAARMLRQNNRAVTVVTVRIRRPSVPLPPFDHRSETEQAGIPDGDFDHVVHNDGTVDELHGRIEKIIHRAQFGHG